MRQQGESDGRPTAVVPAPQVRVLGTICFVDRAGAMVDLPSASQRRLVAVLATRAGSTIRAAQLLDLLGIQSGALRATVSRVRRLIGDDVLVTDPVGYRLEATTDLAEFGELVSSGLASGDLRCFDEALALWHGPAIDEFATEPWAVAVAAHVDELRCLAIEGRAAALIGAGRPGEATASLEMHLTEQPLRDRAHGLLMLSLAQDGRQAEALRAYQRYRAHLAHEVGTVPSAAVRALEQWIADPSSGALDAVWPAPTGSPSDGQEMRRPVEPAAPTSRGIPAFRSSFIGRDRDADEVVEWLRTERAVTLVGEGGVGKTRLAAAAAERMAGGGVPVWFVELAPVSEASDVAGTVAALLGASLADPSEVGAFIGKNRALLVLDNCEHLVDTVAEVVDGLLGVCPDLKVLATSRVRLDVDGERVVRVSPLDPLREASALLLARVEAAGAVLLEAQRADVAALCQQLDGNPLAIELAAPRVAALGLRSVIDGLADRFTLLSARHGRSEDRHGALLAVVEWSDRLLTPDERAIFHLLGVFSGGFELDAARHVAAKAGATNEPLLPLLASLVERSMLVAQAGSHGTRFHLLDTLQAFAIGRLEADGGLRAAADAHADWVASITDAALDQWMTAEGHARGLRLEREIDNWRDAVNHALTTADTGLAVRLSGSPTGLLVWGRPDLVDYVDALATMIGDDEGVDPDGVARAGLAFARWGLAWSRFDHAALLRDCDRFDQLHPDDTTGISATIRSATAIAVGDMRGATAIRSAAIDDPRTNPGGRDLNTAIAVYGARSMRLDDLVPDAWIRRVAELGTSSPVPTIRRLARVAMSVAAADSDPDPERSVSLLHDAFTDPDPAPAYWERLIGTFISRYLGRTAPTLAAKHLLRLLPGADAGLGSADAVTLATSGSLLVSTGHPSADDIVVSLTALVPSEHVSNIIGAGTDRSHATVLGSDRVLPVLRAALEEIAGNG